MAIYKQITGGVARVKEQRGTVYVYDVVDTNGAMLARDRYSTAASAPFVITQAEIDADVTFTVSTPSEPPLAEMIAAAVARTYKDVDSIYDAKVGNRKQEYLMAESAARAYVAAGYTGACSDYIAHWATVKGLTNAQATDAIIAQADALNAAMLALRNGRFDAQSAMSAAIDKAALDAAIAGWDVFIHDTRASLGI